MIKHSEKIIKLMVLSILFITIIIPIQEIIIFELVTWRRIFTSSFGPQNENGRGIVNKIRNYILNCIKRHSPKFKPF
jgi:hypothetical protein